MSSEVVGHHPILGSDVSEFREGETRVAGTVKTEDTRPLLGSCVVDWNGLGWLYIKTYVVFNEDLVGEEDLPVDGRTFGLVHLYIFYYNKLIYSFK